MNEPKRVGGIRDDMIGKEFRRAMPLRVHTEDLQFFGNDFFMFRAGFTAGENYKEKKMDKDLRNEIRAGIDPNYLNHLRDLEAKKRYDEANKKCAEQLAGYLNESDPLNVQVGGSHYKNMAIQPIEFTHKNNLNFCQGNIIKYATRYRAKNGVEDLKKVIHYAQLLAKLEYGVEI